MRQFQWIIFRYCCSVFLVSLRFNHTTCKQGGSKRTFSQLPLPIEYPSCLQCLSDCDWQRQCNLRRRHNQSINQSITRYHMSVSSRQALTMGTIATLLQTLMQCTNGWPKSVNQRQQSQQSAVICLYSAFGVHLDHAMMQCMMPGGCRLDRGSLGHTHIKFLRNGSQG